MSKLQLVIELDSKHLSAFEKFLSSLNGEAPAKGKTKVADPAPDDLDLGGGSDDLDLDESSDDLDLDLEPAPAPKPAPKKAEIDLANIRKAVAERIKDAKKKAKILAAFKQLGVKNVSGLQEKDFKKFWNFLQKL